ncbi:hypothetical protein TNCV_4337731 [Trichonephila clavipes]|uniref:Uncharacterized protein n=1 Tax=Trichonephila clavipes TaxID=2585209 RepID=A0A8X6SN21_TRICX|nr:hypothetical protein TNCV_4337731 [Trichonephila clavipes]
MTEGFIRRFEEGSCSLRSRVISKSVEQHSGSIGIVGTEQTGKNTFCERFKHLDKGVMEEEVRKLACRHLYIDHSKIRVPGKTGRTLLRMHIYFVMKEFLYYERLTRDVKGLVFLFDLSRRKSTLQLAGLSLRQLKIEMAEDIMPPYILWETKRINASLEMENMKEMKKRGKKVLDKYRAMEYFECSAKVGIGCFPIAQYIIQNYTGERNREEE